MRTLTRKERLTGQVGISLLAGMFSMVPAAFGMPVADKTHVNNPTITTPEANHMDVTGGEGTGGHYVAAWTDFSVAQGEKVTFDGGALDRNDYLNIVTGQATSDIAGTIQGGRNVYLVNPNGVIFSETANVNVGSLYVSTQNLSLDDDAVSKFKGGESPLTTGQGMADVVNLGTLAADNIVIEGKNIRVLDTSQILKRDGSTINSAAKGGSVALHSNSGYIHVGYRADNEGETVEPGNVTDYGKDTGKLSATELGYTTTAGALTNYRLVHNASELQNMKTDLGGNYMLANDITAGSMTAVGDESTPFSGKFDGMFYEVKNLRTEGGLFGAISGATIENVGIVGGEVTGKEYQIPYAKLGTDANCATVKAAGALAGYAYGSNTLTNVYNEGVELTDGDSVNGGLVGYAGVGTSTSIDHSRLEISQAYNTGKVVSGKVPVFGEAGTFISADGGGIVGFVRGVTGNHGETTATVELSNTYNTGKVTGYGMIGGIGSDGNATIATSYATPSNKDGATKDALAPSEHVTLKNSYVTTSTSIVDDSSDKYNGFNISNVGGKDTIWRIYEGRTQPLLTAFFKGKAAVSLSDANVSNGTSGSSTAASALHFKENGVEKVYDGRTIKVGNLQGYVSGNVANSNIKKNPAALTGQQVGYTGENSKNAGTYALVYSGQHGYDIVGGNATIKKRPLTISSGENMLLSKVYDGGAVVVANTSAKDLFTASVGEAGLVAGDDVDLEGVVVSGGFYADSGYKTESPDVGVGKYVKIKFNGLYDKDLTGDDAKNYDFTNNLGEDNILTSSNGVITPRGILVNLNKSSDIDKVYDGTTDVTDSEASAKIYNESDAQKGNLVFHKTSENVGMGLLDTDAHHDVNYLDLDYEKTVAYDSKNASSSKNDREIDYTGLKLKLTETGAKKEQAVRDALTKNYYLTDGSSVLYYGGDDLVATMGDQSVTLFQQTNPVSGGTLTATGTISRRVIDVDELKINGSTEKVYDGTSEVKDLSDVTVSIDGKDEITNAANIMLTDADKIAFNVVKGKFVDADKAHAAVNATASGINNAARYASYGVKVSNLSDDPDLLKNYTFVGTGVQDGEDITEVLIPLNADTVYDGTNTPGAFYGDGTITQRTVNVVLPDGKSGITKAYDGGKNVTNTGALTFGGDYVRYADPSDTDHQILEGDVSSVNFGVAAAYDTENVKRDDAGNVLHDKHDITYTVGLTGAKAGNYLVHDAAATDASGDKTTGVQLATLAKGTITPRSVTIDGYAPTKVYDGTKAVTDTGITLGNVLSGDSDKVSVTVDGEKSHYTDKNAGTNKEVKLGGFALSGDKAVNYDLINAPETITVYNGIITPRRLTTGDFALLDDEGQAYVATKAYDGTASYDLANGRDLSYVSAIKRQGDTSGTGLIEGDVVGLKVKTAYFAGKSGEPDPNATDYRSNDIGYVKGDTGAQSLKYEAQASGAAIGNYTFDGTNALNGTEAYSGFSTTGRITPRIVQLAVESGAEKVYDGATTVADTNGYLNFNAGAAEGGSNLETLYSNPNSGYSASGHVVYGTTDAAHQFLESELGEQGSPGDKVYLNVSAEYATKNVIRDGDGNVMGSNPLTYTISIGGNNSGNYRLYNGTTPVGNQARGASVAFTQDANNNLATGKINPINVTATFEGVDKVYDGKDTVDTASLSMNNVTFDSTLANADRGKMSIAATLEGNYIGENAKDVKVVNGVAGTKDVSLRKVAFTDTFGGDAYSDTYAVGNYNFTDTATGTGKITPRPVGELVLKNGNNEITEVSKTYDGSAYYTDELGNTVQAKKTGVEPGDKTTGILSEDEVSFAIDTSNGNSYFADAAGTKNANATGYNGVNTGAQQLIYKVKVTGGSASNYTFAPTTSANAASLVNGNSYDAGSIKGVINRRAITVGQDIKTGIDKIYNGDAGVAAGYEGFGLTVDSDGDNVKDRGYVVYAGDSVDDVKHQLVTISPDDGTALNVGWDISASYDDMQVGGKTLAGKDVYLVNGTPSAKKVTYTVSLTGDAAGNYILNDVSGTNANPPTVKLTEATGTIDQKSVKVIASTQGITKVYDGTTKVTNLQAGTTVDGKIEADDVYASANFEQLKYSSKNVGNDIALEGVDNNNIFLAGDDADNYKLVDVTLSTGKITKRTLYVDFKGTTPEVDDGTGIDRDYNGASDATVPEAYQKIVKLVTVVDPDTDTGVVTSEGAPGPDDVKLMDTYSATYADGNVARGGDGKVTTKEVYYYGFQLQGADKDNYEVVPADGKASSFTKNAKTYNALTGTGTIRPLKVGVSFDPVTKTYDRTEAVSGDYIANDTAYDLVAGQAVGASGSNIVTNIHREIIDLIKDGDSINVSLDRAEYQQRDAGINLGVDYYIAWDNTNYELVAVPTSEDGVLVTETSYADGKVHATVTGYKGTITPKTITKLTYKNASKIYDGNDQLTDVSDFITSESVGPNGELYSGDSLKITGTGTYAAYTDPLTGETYSGATSSIGESAADPILHDIHYEDVQINNNNYILAGKDTYNPETGEITRGTTTVDGKGVIKRAELKVQPYDVRLAQPSMALTYPYTGTVTGFKNGETYSTASDADTASNGDFYFGLDPSIITTPPSGTPIYGWYRNQSGTVVDANSNGTDLNYDRNYTLVFRTGTLRYYTPAPSGGGGGTPGSGTSGGGIIPIPFPIPNPNPNPTPDPSANGDGTNGGGTGSGGSSSIGGNGADGSSARGGQGAVPSHVLDAAATSVISSTAELLAETGSKKVTPDNTILVQVSESDGLAVAANAAETPFSSASVAYKSTGVNAADLSGTGQIVGVSSNAAVNSEIALESSAGSVSISNDSNTESTAELEHSDATVNITTQGGTKSSISLGTSEDGVNLSTGTRSDATTKTTASSSEQTETSSGISIRVQKDDTEEDTETGEENRSKKQDSSLIGLETLKDAVNLGAPMNTAV